MGFSIHGKTVRKRVTSLCSIVNTITTDQDDPQVVGSGSRGGGGGQVDGFFTCYNSVTSSIVLSERLKLRI